MNETAQAFQAGALVGSLLAGVMCGAVPLLIGAVRGRLGLGLASFLGCIGGGYLLGLLLGLPLAAFFTWVICLPEQKTE